MRCVSQYLSLSETVILHSEVEVFEVFPFLLSLSEQLIGDRRKCQVGLRSEVYCFEITSSFFDLVFSSFSPSYVHVQQGPQSEHPINLHVTRAWITSLY